MTRWIGTKQNPEIRNTWESVVISKCFRTINNKKISADETQTTLEQSTLTSKSEPTVPFPSTVTSLRKFAAMSHKQNY